MTLTTAFIQAEAKTWAAAWKRDGDRLQLEGCSLTADSYHHCAAAIEEFARALTQAAKEPPVVLRMLGRPS